MAALSARARWLLLAALGGELLAAFALAVALLDVPAARGPRTTRAALVLRDDVSPFEKLGSELFSRGTLTHRYQHLVYLTRNEPGVRAPSDDVAIAARLTELAARYDAVDVFLLQHARASNLGVLLPTGTSKLGLVYDTGCGDLEQARWAKAAGARAFVGHGGRRSLSPLFYVAFARELRRGQSVSAATEHANRALRGWLDFASLVSGGSVDSERWTRESAGTQLGDPQLAPLGSVEERALVPREESWSERLDPFKELGR